MRVCPNCDYRGPEKVCPDCDFPMLSADGFAPKAGGQHALIGQVFEGRYRIMEMIGEGASGWVFKAEHVTMGQGVALKVLREEAKQNIKMVKRFISEARTSSQLRDPHTVRVFDFGESDEGELYIAMEWLVGKPLSECIDDAGHLPASRVAHIIRQLCFGLREAHGLGLVHRDLKPENVFLVDSGGDPDFVKILDFGIAKAVGGVAAAERRTKLTEIGSTLGTPWYMSPEQACALDLDQRSDLYSLGVMMYEMLAGRLPFDGEVGMKVLMQHVNDPPPPLPVSVGGVAIPAEMAELTMQLLEKKPSQRPADAVEVAHRLKRWATRWTRPSMAAPPSEALHGHRVGAPPTVRQDVPLPADGQESARAPPPPEAAAEQPLEPVETQLSAVMTSPERGPVGLIALLVVLLLGAASAAAYFALRPVGETSAPAPSAKAQSPEAPTRGASLALRVGADAGAAGAEVASANSGGLPSAAAAKAAGAGAVESAGVPSGGGESGESSGSAGAAASKGSAGSVARTSLSTQRIEQIIAGHVPALRRCIKKHVAKGEVHILTVAFTIEATGRLSNIRVTPALGALNGCIVKAIKRLTFPAHDRSSIKFSFPITARNKG